jgi:hypothetical protein
MRQLPFDCPAEAFILSYRFFKTWLAPRSAGIDRSSPAQIDTAAANDPAVSRQAP